MSRLLTLFLFMFSLNSFAEGPRDLFANWAMRDILKENLLTAEDVLRICPPEDCLLVSLGVHNALLNAHLRVLSQDSRYLYEVPYERIFDIKSERQLDAIVPPAQLVAGRKVVFLRSTVQGQSMRIVLPTIVEHTAKFYPREDIGAILIVDFNEANRTYIREALALSNCSGMKEIIRAQIVGPDTNKFKSYHRFKTFDHANPQYEYNPKNERLNAYVRTRVCATKATR